MGRGNKKEKREEPRGERESFVVVYCQEERVQLTYSVTGIEEVIKRY